MRKRIIFLIAALLTIGAQSLFAQMSDDQIINYITSGVAAGKSERQIGTELMAKGVTTSQLQRLLKAYKSGTMSASDVPSVATKLDGNRSGRRPVNLEAEDTDSTSGKLKDGSTTAKEKTSAKNKKKKSSAKSKSVLKSSPIQSGIGDVEVTAPEAEDEELDDEGSPLFDEDGYKRIWGHEIFSSGRLSFEPNQNGATPEDYVLGPGDEIIIDIWGLNEATIKQEITPEGRIIVSQVGPIQLAGLTIKEAKGKIKSSLSKIYSSLRSGSSQMSVTLGDVRTIMVNVMGEVEVPGTYRLSSFSTVFTALYRAGGITEMFTITFLLANWMSMSP